MSTAKSRIRKVLALVLFGLLLLGAASALSIYAYGRFAERAQGEPGHALPVERDATTLDRTVAPLTDAHPGRSGLALYTSNVDAFAVRVLAARAAGRSLDLQYYLWNDDLTGGLLIAEVLAAADRGVRVRLLLDDINAHDADAALRVLDDHPAIEVRMFNPARNRSAGIRRGMELLTRALSLNRRMHNKAWIADNRIAIVGGRNIGDEYFDASPEANFLDADLAIVGPAVRDTSAIFDTFWNSAMVIPIAALAKPPQTALDDLRRRMQTLATRNDARVYLDHVASSHSVRIILEDTVPLRWSDEVAVRSDPPDKSTTAPGDGWLIDHIIAAFDTARARIEVTSPYFVPGDAGVRWLTELRERGVEVAVLTNSLAATDVFAVHGAYARYRVPLLQRGVALYELMPDRTREGSLFGTSDASLHTKAFTVDDTFGFVGSFNFDARSVSLNTEMGVLVRSEPLAKELRASFARKAAPDASYRVMLEGDEVRWRDARAEPPRVWTHEPEASVWRRLGATVIGWLPIESQL